jgi:hypothetical protein
VKMRGRSVPRPRPAPLLLNPRRKAIQLGLATIAGDRSVAPGQRENARSAEHTAGLIQINVCFGRLPVIGNKQPANRSSLPVCAGTAREPTHLCRSAAVGEELGRKIEKLRFELFEKQATAAGGTCNESRPRGQGKKARISHTSMHPRLTR